MSKTLVADHLESLLLEIEYASQNIANCAGRADASPSEVDEALVQALETARRTLESALNFADKNGVPRLSIDAA